jgi:chromosome partitioning protein
VKKAFVLTVSNQKGGVGKTTSVMNLGVALAKQGKRVLLIDSDPQANLTSYLGITPGSGDFQNLRTLDELYLSKRVMDEAGLKTFITQTSAGVDLVPADGNLSGVEYYLFSRSEKEQLLSRAIDKLRTQYDYIFIDTPPSLNLLTLNALCAADGVLVPVQPEFFSLEGIVKVRAAVEDIRHRWNPKLRIVGVLPTQVSLRRKLTTEVLDALRAEMGVDVFESIIHDSSAVTESTGHARSVIDYDRSSKGSQDYLAAAQELEGRLSRI